MNLSFIGMSGAGKSFVGSRFAAKHNLEFVDIDREMERMYGGQSLQVILDTIGEVRFLAEQAKMVQDLEGSDSVVISPGGSVVYSLDAMEVLKRIGKVVYLEVPLPVIKKRIAGQTRGIVGLQDKTIEALYDERVQRYEKWADIVVKTEDKPVEAIMLEIEPSL